MGGWFGWVGIIYKNGGFVVRVVGVGGGVLLLFFPNSRGGFWVLLVYCVITGVVGPLGRAPLITQLSKQGGETHTCGGSN